MASNYDPRWLGIAQSWLADSDVPSELVDKYGDRFAQELQDVAEAFVADVPQLERDADEAARDRHWQQKIDEARGK